MKKDTRYNFSSRICSNYWDANMLVEELIFDSKKQHQKVYFLLLGEQFIMGMILFKTHMIMVAEHLF